MKVTLIGTYRKYGTFTNKAGEDINYDNTFLCFSKPVPEEEHGENSTVCSCGGGIGFECKVKTEKLFGLFDEDTATTHDDIIGLIGTECNIYFNDNGTLDTVLI